MPYIADQYQRAAEEAKQLAAKATDSCERVQLLRLAAQWQRLADYKARLESKPRRSSQRQRPNKRSGLRKTRLMPRSLRGAAKNLL